MSLPYELISLDLDLTFLDANHQISPRNLAAAQHCRDMGVKIVITSGRMFYTTLPYHDALGLDTPVISYNGAFIKRNDTGEVLLDECLDMETALKVLDYGEKHDLQINYYLNDTLYSAKKTKWSDLYSERTKAVVKVVGDLHAVTDKPPTKMLYVDDPEYIKRLYAELKPCYEGQAYVTISNAEYLEFMPPHVNKGKALAIVAKYYGIPREKVIAFGDAGNDAPAIKWAGMGVAMENACEETKAAADLIAPRYDEDGVAVVLEKVFELTNISV